MKRYSAKNKHYFENFHSYYSAIFSGGGESSSNQPPRNMPGIEDLVVYQRTPTRMIQNSHSKNSFRNYHQYPTFQPAPSRSVEFFGVPYAMANFYNRKKAEKKKKTLPPRSLSQEVKNMASLLLLCVSIIVKGVASGNSHWTNYHRNVNFYSQLENFPIMSPFFTNANHCPHDDDKCKLFFTKLIENSKMALQDPDKQHPVVEGTYSRGINSRCETLFLTVSGVRSKYEKCMVFKEYEINEFRVIRFLLITSMVADGCGILLWIFVYIRSRLQSINRLFLIFVSTIGFLSSFLTILCLGLFTQAVDFFDELNLHLGWPFYVCAATCLLTISTCVIGIQLFCADYKRNSVYPDFGSQYLRNANQSPTSVSVIEMERSAVVEEPKHSVDRHQTKQLLPSDGSSTSKTEISEDKSVISAKSSERFGNATVGVSSNYFRRNENCSRSNSSGKSGSDSIDRMYRNYRRMDVADRSFQSSKSTTFNEAL